MRRRRRVRCGTARCRRPDGHVGPRVRRLCGARTVGITGAITGRAIYEGTLDVAEAQAYCDSLKN